MRSYRRILGNMDIVDSAKRSSMMAGIRSKNTRPEMQVRRFLHSRGYRYRLHTASLPSKPDIVLPKHRTVIFVHGCFWHRHPGCRFATTPATNTDRWLRKFSANVARDHASIELLHSLGWRVLVIWECELRPSSLNARLARLDAEISESYDSSTTYGQIVAE